MREFTLTELSRGSGAIVDAAFAAPVTLTKHGKPKLVILRAEEYQKLVDAPPNPRLSRHTHETPAEEAEAMLKALDEALETDNDR